MTSGRYIKTVIIFGLLFLIPLSAAAYYEKSHSLAAKLALQLLELNDQRRKQPLYSEIYAKKHMETLCFGAWNEDFGVVRKNDRSFRHYYDPDAKGQRKGVPYYKYYDAWKMEGAKVSCPEGKVYEGALEWARRGVDRAGQWNSDNPFNWEGAIRAYDYTPESRIEAYRRLGHVVHLLVDMADPDHAANVPHGGSGFMLPESLDEILGPKIQDWIKKSDFDLETKASVLTAICMADIKLKNMLTKGDLSARTIGFEGLIEDTVDPRMVKEFFKGEHTKSNKPSKGYLSNPPPIQGYLIRRMKNLDDYFNFLAYESKDAVRGKKEFSLALGCAELIQFLKVSNSENLKDYLMHPVPTHLKNSATFAVDKFVTHGQLYMVPLINRKDQKEMAMFYDLAMDLITMGVELSAGLMEQFHDIVNPPPYVKSVTINQGGKTVYHASWKDMSVTRNNLTSVSARKWEKQGWLKEQVGNKKMRSGYIETDKPASIIIEFGPTCGSFKEPIDSTSISVSIGETAAQGNLQKNSSATTWSGGFKIPMSLGKIAGETIPIVIKAKDMNTHFDPKTQSFIKGFELDSNPKTPAKASCAGINNYTWTGYEPGEDTHHEIYIKGIDIDIQETGEDEQEKTIVGKDSEEAEDGGPLFYLDPNIRKFKKNDNFFIVEYNPQWSGKDDPVEVFYVKTEYTNSEYPKRNHIYEKQADENNLWSGSYTYPNDPEENRTFKHKEPERWVCNDSFKSIKPGEYVHYSVVFKMHVKARDKNGRVYEAKATFNPHEWKAVDKTSSFQMNYPCVRVSGARQ